VSVAKYILIQMRCFLVQWGSDQLYRVRTISRKCELPDGFGSSRAVSLILLSELYTTMSTVETDGRKT
jgi:hypothetical protein